MPFGYKEEVRSDGDYFAKALTIADEALSEALRVGSHAGALTLNVSAATTVTIPASGQIAIDVLEADTLDGTFEEPNNAVAVGLKPSSSARTIQAGEKILKLALNDGKAFMKAQLAITGAVTGSVDIWLGYAPR